MQQFASAQASPAQGVQHFGNQGNFLAMSSLNRALDQRQSQEQQRLTMVQEDESDNEVASFHDQPPGQGSQEEGGLPAHLRDPNFGRMGNRALRGATPSRSPVGGDVSEDNDDG